jgi:beta-galactosidase
MFKQIIMLLLCSAAFEYVHAQLNPAVPSATSYVTYTSRSFMINGKPTFIIAGEIDYPRIPKALWRDRLMRMKRAGYNTAAFYIFWNAHEPIQGQWHFENNLDVNAWLLLIKELGMYAIVRPGPYVCAEWDFGGFPAWLPEISGMSLRNANTQFLSCCDAYFDKIFPILAPHQINRGGNIIAMQLENEYYASPADAVYKQHLIDKAHASGMEVPYIWSKTNNGAEPVPTPFATASAPWFSTEFWTGWIKGYGEPSASYVTKLERGTWKTIAGGTGGYTHYMILGGTNFGYTASDDQVYTSYDYFAPIGELGQFRSDYYPVKQSGLFAQTFNTLFATSTNGASNFGTLASGLTGYVNKTTGNGTIAVVTNTNAAATPFKVTWTNKSNLAVPTTFNWSLDQDKFAHFLADVPLSANDTIDYSATGILTLKKLGTTTYIVCYGASSTNGQLALRYGTAPTATPAAPWVWNATAKQASITFTYPAADTVIEAKIVENDGQAVQLLIMNTSMANRTWTDSTFIIAGPQYVDENNNLQFPTAGGRAFVYTQSGREIVNKTASTAPANIPLITGWQWRSAAVEAGTSYADTALWVQTAATKPMPALGCPNGYGWYRTIYTASTASTGTLTLPNVHHKAFVFVNGVFYSGYPTVSVPLIQGRNTIAILVAQYNRWKAYNYYSTITDTCHSGLLANVSLNGTGLTGWRFKGGFDGLKESPLMGEIDSSSWPTFISASSWSATTPATDNLPRFWRIDFNYTPSSGTLTTWTLRSTIARAGRGVVWLNGHCLGRNLESQPALFVPQCWLTTGTNTFVVLTENGLAPQKDTLGLVEYRSLAKAGTVHTAPSTSSRGSAISGALQQSSYTIIGNRFTVPKAYTGKQLYVEVYDVAGHKVYVGTIKDNVLDFGRKAGLSKGVHIVKIKIAD